MKSGKGKMFYDNEDKGIYEGDWENDKKDGIGILYNLKSGLFYMGRWKNDLKNGYGVSTLANNSVTD